MPEILFSKFDKLVKAKCNIKEFNDYIIKFNKEQNHLEEISIKDLIFVFDELSKDWQKKDSKLYGMFKELNLGFLIGWLKKKNIIEILNLNFRNITVLDKATNFDKKIIKVSPKGTIVHWIAGNVPLLGLLSLFQGILTKNKNIVKVPESFKNVLGLILEDIDSKTFKFKNKKIEGRIITSSTIVVYVDKNDLEGQSILSRNADIRFAWGGRDAIESIMGLKKKIDCEDIIMGPKISLGVISKEFLDDSKKIDDITNKITRDVFTFDQLGCNAPHNIFIEENSNFSIEDFATELTKKFKNESIKKTNLDRQPIETYNILSERVFYSISDERSALFDDTYNFNIFVDYNNTKVSSPLYNRSIYLKIVKNIMDVPKQFPSGIQTVGVSIDEKRKKIFFDKAIKFGALRIINIGSMGIYDAPWDGILTMDRMVRWISLPR